MKLSSSHFRAKPQGQSNEQSVMQLQNQQVENSKDRWVPLMDKP